MLFRKKKPKKDIDEFEGLEKVSATNTELYNGMIYPFTRMVVTGAIWYQGESNSGYNRDKYICTFSKMITYWRQVWNTRTNGITNLQFPFGFVQVGTKTSSSNFSIFFYLKVINKPKFNKFRRRFSMDSLVSNIRCWLRTK